MPLPKEARLRVRRRLVGLVAPLLALEIDGRVAGIVVFWRLPAAVFALEALVACPGLDQGSVNREMFVGEERPLPCQIQDASEKLLGHVTREQPVPILGEGRGVPDRGVHAEPDEPAEHVAKNADLLVFVASHAASRLDLTDKHHDGEASVRGQDGYFFSSPLMR